MKRFFRNIFFKLQRLVAEIIQQYLGEDFFICDTCLAVTHNDCMGHYYSDVTTCGNCAEAGKTCDQRERESA